MRNGGQELHDEDVGKATFCTARLRLHQYVQC